MQRRWICRRIRSYLASASFQRNWSSSQVQTTGSIFCAGNALVTGTRLRAKFCALAWHLSTRENRHREFLLCRRAAWLVRKLQQRWRQERQTSQVEAMKPVL